jgi:hypothetical protein
MKLKATRRAVRRPARRRTASDTQLNQIRDLMMGISHRGGWLTLREVAQKTGIGEASISAQLRHLRKPEFGGYTVHKRLRRAEAGPAAQHQAGQEAVWEYRVLSADRENGSRRHPVSQNVQAVTRDTSGSVGGTDAEARN